MAARLRAGARFARNCAQEIPRSGGGVGGVRGNCHNGGAARPGAGSSRATGKRDFRALPRSALRARSGPQSAARRARASLPVMLDRFVHFWDEFDDS
jgi:hypothetical protein